MKRRLSFLGMHFVASPNHKPVVKNGAAADGGANAATPPLDVFTMPIAALEENASLAKKEIAEVIARRLPGLSVLTVAERKASGGKLREGEDAALLGVANAALAAPDLFRAWRDQGNNPAALADSLQRSIILGGVAASVTSEGSPIGDSRLIISGDARAPLLKAYPIAKDNAAHDKNVKRAIVTTIDFYSAIGQKSARTRKANLEAAQNGTAKPSAKASKKEAAPAQPAATPATTPDSES